MRQNIFNVAYHGALLISVIFCEWSALSMTLLEEWELEKKNQNYFNAHANTFLAEPLIEWSNMGKPAGFQLYLQELERRIEFYKKFYSTNLLDKARTSLIRNTDDFFKKIEDETLYCDVEWYRRLKTLYKGDVQPLEIAIFADAAWAIDAFIQAGALLNSEPSNKYTPLHLAILKVATEKTKDLSVIEKLLNAGADPNPNLLVRKLDGSGDENVGISQFVDALVFSSGEVQEKIKNLLNKLEKHGGGTTLAIQASGQPLGDLLLALSQGFTVLGKKAQ